MTASTAELRWFLPGPLPAGALAWLAMEERHRQEPRTDDYALLPGSAVVGVKLRAGRLEVKALAQAVGPLRLTPAIEGLVETWGKLAVQVPDGPGLDQSLHAEAVMVSIDKTRWLRRFALDGAAGPVEVAAGTTPARGCDVELTQLRVRGSDWWTVGLEAFGDPPGIEGCLKLTARAVLLSGEPPCRLSHGNSLSYPAWLASLELA
jgi:hypothetical protein